MRRITLVVVLLMILAACGGDSGSSGGDGSSDGGSTDDTDRTVDVCSLLTAAELEEWLGSPVDSVGPSEAPGAEDETCRYESTSNQMSILISVRDGEQFFAGEGSGARGPDTISGIGEDAHSDGSYIEFLSNGFSARVSRIQGDIPLADLEAIAVLLESRLP